MTAEVCIPGMASWREEIPTSTSSACGTNTQDNIEQSMCEGWCDDPFKSA